jgi:hypothetical protein
LEKRRYPQQKKGIFYLIFQAYQDPTPGTLNNDKMNFEVIYEGGTQGSRPTEIYLA